MRRRRGKGYITYINIPVAFDIETTSTFDKQGNYDAFMYHWQICINGYVIFGRTWDEYQDLISYLVKQMEITQYKRLVIYVHFLGYEFHFLQSYFSFTEIFARNKRHPITALTFDGIEYRCSWTLTNKSLELLLSSTPSCQYFKDKENLDYSLLRHHKTKLCNNELSYCYVDVAGLCECIEDMLKEDTIASIPLTSTGYVRRDVRKYVFDSPEDKKKIQNMRMDLDLYLLCKSAFRGGNTHANRFNSGEIIDDVTSLDETSAYIACILIDYFPMSQFTKVTPSEEDFIKYLDKYCTIFEAEFYGIALKPGVTNPYISLSKCIQTGNNYIDNGRILTSDYIKIAITEIDYAIILSQYDIDKFAYNNVYIAKRGKLPASIRNCAMQYFYYKCTLQKDSELYIKSKNKLNAIFGMFVTDPLFFNVSYDYDTGEWREEKYEEIENPQKRLDRFNNSRSRFLYYPWGIYVTAHARRRLQVIIDIVGEDNIYNDTDSAKIKNYELHKKEIDKLNDIIYNEAIRNDIPAIVSYNGKNKILGYYEYEENYKNFKTLGAKKYCYTDKEGEYHITVSGMDKIKGAKAIGCIENFEIGFSSSDVGRTSMHYLHRPIKPEIYTDYQGNTATVYRGCGIASYDTTYTLGVTDEYYQLIFGTSIKESRAQYFGVR